MFSTPEVSGDLVFIGSCSGVFYALDRRSGEVRWSYDIKQDGNQTSFHGDMLITDDLAIIGTDTNTGHVYAFEKTTGRARWRFPAGPGVPTDIVRSGDRIYAVTFDDELICLDLPSGKLHWRFRSQAPAAGRIFPPSAAATGDRVFFGGRDGIVYALDAVNGRTIWTRNLGSRVSMDVKTQGASLYAGTEGRVIYRLSQQTGEILATLRLESIPVGRPTFTPEGVYVFMNNNGVPGQASRLAAFDPALKSILWHQDSDWTATKSHLWNGYLLTGVKGALTAHRLENGDAAWSIPLEGYTRSMNSGGDTLYVGTIEGQVYALDGTQRMPADQRGIRAAQPAVQEASPYNFQPKDERDGWQRVPEVFEAMGIKSGSRVADIGAGWGYFTTRLGHAVGAEGRIYAVDIDADVLKDLRKTVEKEGLKNVEAIVSKPDNPLLTPGSLDAALIVNSYHEMTDYRVILAHIFQALKPGGRLVILDMIVDKRRNLDRSQQTDNHQLGMNYVIGELVQAGFVITRAQDPFITTPYNETEWMVVGQRPDTDGETK